MLKRFALFLIAFTLLISVPYARADTAAGDATDSKIREAEDVSDCGGKLYRGIGKLPPNDLAVNCIFLEEPIGGKPGKDLYVVECEEKDNSESGAKMTVCEYKKWRGGAVGEDQHGPIQAIMSYEKGKQWQSSFGLLYNYVGVVYRYLSGVIIGVVVLMVVIGGIQITTSGGDTSKRDAGRDRIMQALLGMALWFLSSLLLYTINPTFFRF